MNGGLDLTQGDHVSRIIAIIVLGLALYDPVPPLPPPTRYCVLAIPPSYVVRYPQLEAVYCRRDHDGICVPYQLGWVVVSEAVPCD